MENEIIKRVLIFDGENEFNPDDIFRSKELHKFITKSTLLMPSSLYKEIIKENGTIYITTDKNLEKFSAELINVSNQLYDQFFQKYKQDSL